MPGPLRTYARRRTKARIRSATASSTLQVLDREDISFGELSHRMLKRARLLEDQVPVESRADEGREQKRVRRSILGESSPVLSYDPTDPLSYYTPAPSPPAAPPEKPSTDRLSPVPNGRKIFSRRTSSRNLKENKAASTWSRSSSRARPALESPFHSRPGSATNSPEKKKLGRKKLLKSRTLSDSKTNTQIRGIEPAFTLNHSTQNSPHTRTHPAIKHHRNPSGPNFQTISPENWLVPPKILSSSTLHRPLVDISPYAYDFSPAGSHFDSPNSLNGITHSTPFCKGKKAAPASEPLVYAPKALLDHDVDMDTSTMQLKGRQLRFSPTHFADKPCTLPNALPASKLQSLLQSPRLTDAVAHGFEPSSFPVTQIVDDRIGVDYMLPSRALALCDEDDPVVRTGLRPVTSKVHERSQDIGSPDRLELKDMFDDLDLGARESQVRVLKHSNFRSSPAPRTRSLDSPAHILSPDNPRLRKRNRASTIKASDLPLPGLARRTRSGTVTQGSFSVAVRPDVEFPPPSSDALFDAPMDMGKGNGMTKRTRSGTITQRKVSLGKTEVEVPLPESDESGLFDCLGTSKRLLSSPGPSGVHEESDDELLMTGPWPDEDWVVCSREGEERAGMMVDDESDDELDLFKAGDPW